jgi:hypothetical protein
LWAFRLDGNALNSLSCAFGHLDWNCHLLKWSKPPRLLQRTINYREAAEKSKLAAVIPAAQ